MGAWPKSRTSGQHLGRPHLIASACYIEETCPQDVSHLVLALQIVFSGFQHGQKGSFMIRGTSHGLQRQRVALLERNEKGFVSSMCIRLRCKRLITMPTLAMLGFITTAIAQRDLCHPPTSLGMHNICNHGQAIIKQPVLVRSRRCTSCSSSTAAAVRTDAAVQHLQRRQLLAGAAAVLASSGCASAQGAAVLGDQNVAVKPDMDMRAFRASQLTTGAVVPALSSSQYVAAIKRARPRAADTVDSFLEMGDYTGLSTSLVRFALLACLQNRTMNQIRTDES